MRTKIRKALSLSILSSSCFAHPLVHPLYHQVLALVVYVEHKNDQVPPELSSQPIQGGNVKNNNCISVTPQENGTSTQMYLLCKRVALDQLVANVEIDSTCFA
ncbi:hypothetical protein V8B97DRAFT_785274 [Scleroderma yunnanense]